LTKKRGICNFRKKYKYFYYVYEKYISVKVYLDEGERNDKLLRIIRRK